MLKTQLIFHGVKKMDRFTTNCSLYAKTLLSTVLVITDVFKNEPDHTFQGAIWFA